MTGKSIFAPPPADAQILEEGSIFTPRFGPDGLIPCITVDAGTGTVLMLAYMNAEALARTIETGEAWYWSRSRKSFWRKGETSGQTQTIVGIRTDCDQDALLLEVRVGGDGDCCHTGRQSCFYRTIVRDGSRPVGLRKVSGAPHQA